ncbi:enoyl-CoA hydratase/isomerase family protein [Leekyejoonella antrihumi]|uniref:enoyl-CoA hydratase/isomerase family protein n=1 Tax=Leekyejoonella antrihumi TaxID=1660198 RepID=UPI001C96E4EE|nr:enoyl-CoA hydratase/isomerase family protein [Leekyejoonella antrihumi]
MTTNEHVGGTDSATADLDDHVICDVRGPIATVTLSNPSKRNAMTARMWRELPGVLAVLAADPEVRAVVLTGAGGHFCAGADISSLTETLGLDDAGLGNKDGGGMPLSAPERAEEALAAFPKPTIAAIRGACVGGGVQLAVACDLRITRGRRSIWSHSEQDRRRLPATHHRAPDGRGRSGRGQAPAVHR